MKAQAITDSTSDITPSLAEVGLASIGLVRTLLSLQTRNHGVAYWLAVAGSGYFAFHTTILDAVIWAALFRR